MIEIALATAGLFCLLVYSEWSARRDRQAAAATLERCRAELAAERDRAATELAAEQERAAKERRELYQRIQAPEVAVHDAALEARRERPYVRRQPIGADDDAAFAARRADRQAERDREVASG